MTVHRWERSQRGIQDHLLDQICELYNRPLGWFLTIEDGDLEDEQPVDAKLHRAGTEVADRVYRKIAGASADQRAMIEKVVEDMLDGFKRVA